jgi:ATP synthase protein I
MDSFTHFPFNISLLTFLDTIWPRPYTGAGSHGQARLSPHVARRAVRGLLDGRERTRRETVSMSDDGNDDAEMRARLEALSKRLDQRRVAEQREALGGETPGGETGRAMSLGFRILSEFVAGVAVGGLIGWLIDKWLSSSPLFLIVFLALGTAAGFWSVYKIAAAPTGRSNSTDANDGADAP